MTQPTRQPRRSKAGFTLAELMLTVMILLLVALVSATGISTAVQVYRRAVDKANAPVLLSTAVSELRNKLSTAVEIESCSGTEVTFRSSTTKKTTLSQDDDGINIIDYQTELTGSGTDLGAASSSVRSLIPPLFANQSRQKDIKVSWTNIALVTDSNNVVTGVTVTGLKVTAGEDEETKAELEDPLFIKLIARNVKAPNASAPVGP